MFKTKVHAGIAILVVLGMLAMLYIYRSLGDVAGYLSTLDNVGVPFSIASLEMEKNTGEYANGVLRYVSDPDPAVRIEALRDIDDFNERHVVFMQLSTNDRERALGIRVDAEHQRLTALGHGLMDQRDRLDALFEETADLLEQIDTLADGPMLAAAPLEEPARSMLLAALANLEAETAEIGFWLTLFRNRPIRLARERLLEKVDEQRAAVADYHDLILDPEQRQVEDAVHALHLRIAANVDQLLEGEIDISLRAQQLDQLAERIDGIFDRDIQTMLMNDLAKPQQNADKAIAHVQGTLRYIIPAYALLAVAVGVFLIFAIIRPLKKLATGTEVLGSGKLDHRIEARGNDEFGKLARQFNLMAARLQESTVSRDLLEASEQRLQRTVVELRQEIAERQQAERDREKLQARLQRTETLAAMGRLVAGVAHEVRNPLFGISSTLDAMEANATIDHAQARYWEVLRREAKRLNKLMAELLEYGRTPPAERSIEPLGRNLAEAIRNCQVTAAAAGVHLVHEAGDDALVSMNHDRLLQVHVNLIENALQHAPAGSQVTVATRASTDEAGQAWIECSVADGGPGFAPADLPRIFEPFFTRRRKGTGLGLAIVRRIVDEHHGSIEPANRARGGALMTLRLPVAKAPA